MTEKSLVRLIARIVPWLAPLPSAYFVGRSSMAHLNVPIAVAAIMALIIEFLGLSSMHAAMAAYDWNKTKRKSDPGAPVLLGYALSAVYFVATLSLVIALEVWPGAETFAPALFPILAVVGYLTLSMIDNQTRREQEVAEAKAEAAAKRRARREEKKREARQAEIAEARAAEQAEREAALAEAAEARSEARSEATAEGLPTFRTKKEEILYLHGELGWPAARIIEERGHSDGHVYGTIRAAGNGAGGGE